MVNQGVLEEAAARALQSIGPSYLRKPLSADLKRRFRGELQAAVALEIPEPFEIELIDNGHGSLSLRAIPLMTPEEEDARRREFDASMEMHRQDRITADKERAALYPSSAAVRREGSHAYVDIDGMIADLGTWQTDLMNEESDGFHRALADVRRYLLARKKRG